MVRESLHIIRDEQAAVAAMLRSLSLMVQRGPGDAPDKFFDVLRAMLFYIDEFPERQHHPKESELLFPKVLQVAPQVGAVIDRLDQDHARSEAAVRELQHYLQAWELLGDSRRAVFEQAARSYVDAYLGHMRLEETDVTNVNLTSKNIFHGEELDQIEFLHTNLKSSDNFAIKTAALRNFKLSRDQLITDDFLLETLLSSMRFKLNSNLSYSEADHKLDLKNSFIQLQLLKGQFDLFDFDKLFPKFNLLKNLNLKNGSSFNLTGKLFGSLNNLKGSNILFKYSDQFNFAGNLGSRNLFNKDKLILNLKIDQLLTSASFLYSMIRGVTTEALSHSGCRYSLQPGETRAAYFSAQSKSDWLKTTTFNSLASGNIPGRGALNFLGDKQIQFQLPLNGYAPDVSILVSKPFE